LGLVGERARIDHRYHPTDGGAIVTTDRSTVVVFRAALLLLAFWSASPALLAGQSCEEPRCLSAREMLQRFSFEAEANTSDFAHFAVLHTLTRSTASVTPARRDSVADGLVDLALNADGSKTRIKAALYLTSSGSAELEVALPDAAHRVVRVLRSSRDRQVRGSILATAFWMKDRRTLVPVLSEVARDPGEILPHTVDRMGDEATEAILALSRMGEEGLAALRELHRRRAVRSHGAASVLENLLRGSHPDERSR
jgi:hypothetical protein